MKPKGGVVVMTGRDRCDEILRLIDEALEELTIGTDGAAAGQVSPNQLGSAKHLSTTGRKDDKACPLSWF